MIKILKILLLALLVVLIMPIFSILALSLQSTGGQTLKWYKEILNNSSFTNSFYLTVFVSICTTILTLIISFIISLSWFNKRQLKTVAFIILVLGLMPPDIIALSISKTAQFLGFYSSNLFFLIIGLTFYCLPFAVLLLWARYYFIEDSLITAARDLGIRKFYIVTKVILPLSSATIISCSMLSFLLAFNEYPRTYYLSGSYELLSEFLNGKLSSGTDESIYAGGSIAILVTLFTITAVGLYYFIQSNKNLSGRTIPK